jgi:hypothetical protein
MDANEREDKENESNRRLTPMYADTFFVEPSPPVWRSLICEYLCLPAIALASAGSSAVRLFFVSIFAFIRVHSRLILL